MSCLLLLRMMNLSSSSSSSSLSSSVSLSSSSVSSSSLSSSSMKIDISLLPRERSLDNNDSNNKVVMKKKFLLSNHNLVKRIEERNRFDVMLYRIGIYHHDAFMIVCHHVHSRDRCIFHSLSTITSLTYDSSQSINHSIYLSSAIKKFCLQLHNYPDLLNQLTTITC